MAYPASTIQTLERGSQLGADGVYYPAEEERTVPLGERGLRLMFYLFKALDHLFRAHANVHVGGDQFMYWEPGNPRKRIAPDVYAIKRVPKLPPRAVIRIWEEATPSLVVEISSKGSRKEDRGEKFRIYQDVLGCPEYLIWDDDSEELFFYRLEAGVYRLQEPDTAGRLHSRELGVWFVRDPEVTLRVLGPDGSPVPDFAEWGQQYEELERSHEKLERSHEELERSHEVLERQRFEEQRRNEALAAEVERLRAEVERLRGEASRGN